MGSKEVKMKVYHRYMGILKREKSIHLQEPEP